MVVSDEAVMVVLLSLINYLILYRKNKMMGSLFFFVIGMGVILLITDASMQWVGMLIAFIGIMSFSYEAFGKKEMGRVR